VHDVNAAAVAQLAAAGAATAASPREVGQAADVAITMLPDAPDVEQVVLGPRGLAEGLRRGSVLIEMSTIDPATTQRIGAALADRGVRMLDSPVGKTADHAVSGTLTLMVGGEAALLEEMRPILTRMGTDFFHCGPLGMGQAMKLSNNLLANIVASGCCEVLVAGVKAGLKLELMLDVMRTTMAWNNQLAIAMPKKAFVGDFSPGFMVRLARKDVRLALTLADQAGVQADLGRAALAVLDRAVEAGMGAQDSAALLRLREQEAGVEVRLAANTGRG
jgi:4-hydroxybutyrate dehydrogenase/sulfolactaldehyde 3-reductase